jgi:mRNA interferase HigB
VFNVLNNKTLLEYMKQYPEAAEALKKLYYELVKAEFKDFNELKQVYGNASIVHDNRVVFNVSGNKYRLVVRVNFQNKRMMIKWFGTHKEYDTINVTTIQRPNRSN